MGSNRSKLLSREKTWILKTNGERTYVQKNGEGCRKEIVGNVVQFVRYWCWDEVGVEGDGPSSSHRRLAAKEI